MKDIEVTLDTSHFEMLPLNAALALLNVKDMSVTVDTSQSPIGGYGPLAQSPTGDIFQHLKTAVFNSALLRGLNTVAEGLARVRVMASVPLR